MSTHELQLSLSCDLNYTSQTEGDVDQHFVTLNQTETAVRVLGNAARTNQLNKLFLNTFVFHQNRQMDKLLNSV